MSIMRSKSALSISAGLAALLLAGSIFLLVQGRRGAEQARSARDLARRDLERFYAQNPFPTDDNVLRTRTNVVQLSDWYERLSELLRAGQLAPADQSPAVFIERLNSQVNALRRESPRVAGERVVSENFAFGFDAYLGAGGALPEPEHVRRLTRQLQLVRLLVDMAYDAGVMRITAVSREVFERPQESARERTPRAAGAPTAARLAQTGAARESGLYSRERITMNLRLRPETLSTVLNRLSSMQPLATVENLSIRKSGPDIRPAQSATALTAPAAPRASAGFPGLPGAPAPTVDPVVPADMSREQRLVSGPDLDPPLDVNIGIDIYHFEGG
jgi:hypothetical protein